MASMLSLSDHKGISLHHTIMVQCANLCRKSSASRQWKYIYPLAVSAHGHRPWELVSYNYSMTSFRHFDMSLPHPVSSLAKEGLNLNNALLNSSYPPTLLHIQ